VAVLSLLAVLRIAHHDGTYLLTCVNAFTLYVYLPVYLLLGWAVWRRRWYLAALGGFVALCHVVWIAPDFTPAQTITPSLTASEDASPSTKILVANLSAKNAEQTSLLAEVERIAPDIVIFVEYHPLWHRIVMASSIATKYKYGTGLSIPYLGEVAVFSKRPITNIERYWPTGRQVCLFDVPLGSATLRLFCLHSPRPTDLKGHDYFKYWQEVWPLLVKQTGPLVCVGDFNATQHSKVYQQMTSGRLRSAHVDRGRGYATTWPNGKFLAPPIRIDQAFLSPEVECLEIVEGEGKGSDHRPLVLDVRVRRGPPGPAG
jgi:endonuclease/exonuclease/phosphatase (EEP) superfamily protein YafD